MTAKERVLHMILFEVIALLIFVPLAVFIFDRAVIDMTGLGISLSLIAMAWNYLYNLGFDHVYGYERLSRKVRMRIAHGVGFELGMLCFLFRLLCGSWSLASGRY